VCSAYIRECAPVDISDVDVLKAMKTMQGYIDITPADFKEVYRIAYGLAQDRMMHAVKAVDVMTSPVHVIGTDMDLIATATLLAEKGISGAPVVDRGGRVIGVISEKDFFRKMDAGHSGSFMHVIAHCLKNKGCVATPMVNRTASDIMVMPAITATVDITIGEISALLMEKNINRLPIIASDGKPVGIVTRSDLVSSFCMFG